MITKFKSRTTLALAVLVIVEVLTSNTTAYGNEPIWQYSGPESNGVIIWSEQGLNFPSFFAPNNQQCAAASESCDTSHASYGHGFVDYSVCADASELYCIESLQVAKNGKTFPASLIEEAAWTKVNVPLEHGVIRGGAPTIWNVKFGEVNQRYAVKVFSGFSWNQGPAHVDKLEMAIAPVSNSSGKCSLNVGNNCYREEDFEAGERVFIKLRLPANLGGFFMGRMDNAIINQADSNNGISRSVELAADPVEVPRVAVQIPMDDKSVQQLCSVGNRCGFPVYDGSALGVGGLEPAWKSTVSATDNKSQARGRVWRVYAMSPAQTDYRNCVTRVPGFLGSASTNALLYDYNPPKFSDGFFKFKVGGLHYQSNGTLELGVYQARISAAFARCLYGFTSAPISATVSVVDADGAPSTAITTVGEKDGWLNVAASGFTFSSPTISVKLSQAKAPDKKTTITCVKGKLAKKVTAFGPKCPAGYKKK